MIQIRSPLALRRLACLFAVGALTIALPAALPAQPAGAGDKALADATVYSGGVALQPKYDYSYRQAIVTVAGGDVLFSRTFEPGESISVELFDLQGEPLPDGRYNWQLQLIPDEAAARELRVAATENGGVAPGAWIPQSGSFAILGGQVASPDLAELGSAGAGSGLERESRLGRAMTTSSFGRSEQVIDDDAAVGFDVEAEVKARADAARASAAIAPGGNMNFERSDAAALAAGGSLESAPTFPPSFSGEAEPAPRSTSPDGKNGRPRSRDEVR